MKYILFIFSFCLSLGLLAQTKTQPKPSSTSSDCYKDWYLMFKERGAKPVPDGIQDVIITLRNKENLSVCFMGKIEVKDGKLASKLQVQKVDGTYEEFDRKISAVYQNSDGVLKEELREINNGTTPSLELTDGESIKLFFYKSLNDKPKANKKAADPNTLVK